MSQYFGLFVITLLSPFLYCETCVVYNFERDFDDMFTNNSTLCGDFQSWNIGSYTNINVEQPHESSNKFIYPNSAFSCVTSFPFAMEVGGEIEVKIYIESVSPSDFISIIVNAINPTGNDVVVATYMYNSAQADFNNGWHDLTMTTIGLESFDGYISLLGIQSEGSKILVDSLRYISPKNIVESCSVYEDVESTTRPASNSVDNDKEKCVTYDFEAGFDNLFTLDKRLCEGFVTWSLGNYSSIGMEGIDADSDLFLTPDIYQSCTASFPFNMTPGGTVEVNVYVEPITSLDHIIVLAKKLVSEGVDTVAGMYIYEPSRANFVTGWNVLSISVVDLSDFQGYLVFLGSAAEGATVLVDSFRYIPPTITDHESCAIY